MWVVRIEQRCEIAVGTVYCEAALHRHSRCQAARRGESGKKMDGSIVSGTDGQTRTWLACGCLGRTQNANISEVQQLACRARVHGSAVREHSTKRRGNGCSDAAQLPSHACITPASGRKWVTIGHHTLRIGHRPPRLAETGSFTRHDARSKGHEGRADVAVVLVVALGDVSCSVVVAARPIESSRTKSPCHRIKGVAGTNASRSIFLCTAVPRLRFRRHPEKRLAPHL